VADLGLILGKKKKNQRRKQSQQGKQNKTAPSAQGLDPPLAFYFWFSYEGIFVYNICLISISNSVSDQATKKSFLNIESA